MRTTTYTFNPETVVRDCIQWIQDWFEKNGKGCSAVIGMSGGKDSTIAAALCARALGPENVIGVAMPDNGQGVNKADEICKYLGINYLRMPISGITGGFSRMWTELADEDFKWSMQAEQNIPPRIRMTLLYAVAQTYNGRVIETCNFSENYIGYFTLFGDGAGSMSPLGGLTVTEILQIGDYMGLPHKWVHKVPDDGLPHSCSDEEKIGFSYKELDKFIREGIEPEGSCTNSSNTLKIDKIKKMNSDSDFKRSIVRIPFFEPRIWSVS